MANEEIGAWRLIGSRTIVEDRWLRLRADACETPDGEVLDPFYVIDCRDWVAVVALTAANDLVLVRQYRHAVARVTLELPAGEIDTNEDAIAAARRELWEETGYRGGEATIVRRMAGNPARNSNSLWVVLIRDAVAAHEAPPPQTGGELTLSVLRPFSSVNELLLCEDFQNPQHLGALAAAMAASF